MTTIKMNTETHSWMKYLSPTAKALLFAVPMMVGSQSVRAEETAGEKVQSGYEEVEKDVKQEYRNAQNKSCNPKDGDKNCTMKKIKNKLKNARDEVSQEAKEQKRKID